MNSEIISLESKPMPYMTECSIKRFNKNEYHCARYTTHYVMIFMLKHELSFEEDGTPVTLLAGEWYIQRSHMHQSASSPSPSAEYWYIHFTGEKSENIFNSLSFPVRGTYDRQAFDAPLAMLYRLANQAQSNPFETQQRFIGLLGMLYETCMPRQTPATQILRYIDNHFQSHITSKTLSDAFSYSTEYVERRVKEEIGMTPHAYLTKRRLDHARRQLERSNLTIGQVGEECGFQDASVFFRAFRKEYGMNPSLWRNNTRVFGKVQEEEPESIENSK